MNSETNFQELENVSLKVREHVIRMATDGGCFIGASLSCVDILVYLYFKYLNINSFNLKDSSRDYLFLSKGHDVPALYGTLVEKGILETDRLKNHLKTNDNIYWHPNTKIPGVEFHSGSLGHLISVSAGVAYDCKQHASQNKIVVILGDGEMNEGSIWETLLIASAKKLDNLIIIIDRNQFQANVSTEELIPLEPLDRKLEAFGCQVFSCNGHNFEDLDDLFSSIKFGTGFPTAIIADTIRGKGLPSIEAKADRWFCNFSHDEINSLLNELHTKTKTEIVSEILVVR
jgi:transketolase